MFFYGPTPNDGDPKKMWHALCGQEVTLHNKIYQCECDDYWEETEVNIEERRVNGPIRGIAFND